MPHALIQIVCQKGSNIISLQRRFFCLFYGKIRRTKCQYLWATIGPPGKRHLNTIAGVPLMAQHYMLAWLLCDFSGDRVQYC